LYVLLVVTTGRMIPSGTNSPQAKVYVILSSVVSVTTHK
jgi:hypothetical protein